FALRPPRVPPGEEEGCLCRARCEGRPAWARGYWCSWWCWPWRWPVAAVGQAVSGIPAPVVLAVAGRLAVPLVAAGMLAPMEPAVLPARPGEGVKVAARRVPAAAARS